MKILLRLNSFFLSVIKNIEEILNLINKYINRRIFMRLFEGEDKDIYVVTYMKSGTTLMQMILYQLLTNGEMDFNHIYNVSPWIDEMSEDYKNVKIINNLKQPRILKSHALYNQFPKNFKGRIIYVSRNGMDVANSSYHHFKNYTDPDLKWDTYIDKHFLNDNKFSWFAHVKQWKENINDFDILFVTYEEITKDLYATTKKIAKFLEISPSDEVFERVLERCNFSYMKRHQKKFGEQPEYHFKVYDQFIRQGKSFVGEDFFSDAQKAKYYQVRDKYFLDDVN